MPRKPRRKPLIWLWRLLTVWMCSAHPLAGRGVDALVRDVERRRDGRIAAVGVGDEQRIRGEDRLQHVLHAVCVQRRQGMAGGRAAAVGGDQDRHLLAREAALLGLAAAPARLALQLPLPLPALKDEGLVRLDDPRKPVRRLAHRRQEAVAPAMRRARRNPAALGRLLDRLACAKRGAKGKPTLLVVQPGSMAEGGEITLPAGRRNFAIPLRARSASSPVSDPGAFAFFRTKTWTGALPTMSRCTKEVGRRRSRSRTSSPVS